MKGRKPVPTNLKILHGNPGKRPLNKNEPVPVGEVTQPEWLTENAKKHWDITCKQLQDAGVMSGLDIQALAVYCEAFAKWKDAMDMVEQHGSVIRKSNGDFVQSPYFRIAEKQQVIMVKLLVEFGMTPSSRSRVERADPVKENKFKMNGRRAT